MSLTDSAVKALKAKPAKYDVGDGEYLFIRVYSTGKKSWVVMGRINGFRPNITIGEYPYMTLKSARLMRDEIVECYKSGQDYKEKRANEIKAKEIAKENTFKHWAERWLNNKNHATSTRNTYLSHLQNYILPALGDTPVSEITRKDIINFLEPLGRETWETMKKSRTIISGTLALARDNEVIEFNPAADVNSALPARPKTTHYPAIKEPRKVGKMLNDLYHGYDKGTITVKYALKISPHVMLRPGELRQSQWAWIDFDSALWRIPSEVMKGRQAHAVPLSTQVIELLRGLHAITGNRQYIFPHKSNPNKFMSENTINQALHSLGYKGEQTAHGLRHTASTLLNEQAFESDWIEKQLSHKDSSVRGVYNQADYLQHRRDMMQKWSDYLDELRERYQ